jgi:hypothetical protein
MTLVVEEDVAPDPIYISMLGTEGVVLGSEGVPHLVEELSGARGIGHGRARLAKKWVLQT